VRCGDGVKRTTVLDVPVRYEEVGAGRPLLVLHGWPGDHRAPKHFLEPLFEGRTGWRRLYPDLPGCGETPGADWITNQDDMLAVALGFLDALAPGEPFAVVGLSYGAHLARGAARLRRTAVSGLLFWVPMIVGEGPPNGGDRPPAHQVLVRDPATPPIEPDEALWSAVAVVQTPLTLATFRAVTKPGLGSGDAAFRERVAASGWAFSFPLDAPEPCEAPALILAGRQDGMTGYRAAWSLLEVFPRATFAVLDRAGHALAAEQDALFRALVGEWLDRVEEGAAGRSRLVPSSR
jgi:pimeloyl-ACP methyl ester carboxylesterase